ncbi:MAG: hypothetical protein HQ541_20000 [Mariniphaga sp.]|nr:hypothetical protein [Mariniphaga sp.]
MLSVNLTTYKQIENSFYDFCLDYFDDPSDEKHVVFKIQVPNIYINNNRIVMLIQAMFGVLIQLFLTKPKIDYSTKEFPLVENNTEIHEYSLIGTTLSLIKGKRGFIVLKLQIPLACIFSIRRFIFANRFT